jgi:hypothetical protein
MMMMMKAWCLANELQQQQRSCQQLLVLTRLYAVNAITMIASHVPPGGCSTRCSCNERLGLPAHQAKPVFHLEGVWLHTTFAAATG